VQKKFLKIWYKRKKITLHDMSLSKPEGPTGATKEVIARKIIAELEVESEEEPTEAYEQILRKGIKRKPRSYMTQRNHMLKSPSQKNQELRLLYIAIHTTWRNNNHQGKSMGINKLIMDQHGTQKASN
jgi:hypothetical protein